MEVKTNGVNMFDLDDSHEFVIKYQDGWRWPRIESLDNNGIHSNSRQCILTGCFYLVNGILLSKTSNGNLETFLSNLSNFMLNKATGEDYTNDGNGMRLDKINDIIKKEWNNIEELLFGDLQTKVKKSGVNTTTKTNSQSKDEKTELEKHIETKIDKEKEEKLCKDNNNDESGDVVVTTTSTRTASAGDDRAPKKARKMEETKEKENKDDMKSETIRKTEKLVEGYIFDESSTATKAMATTAIDLRVRMVGNLATFLFKEVLYLSDGDDSQDDENREKNINKESVNKNDLREILEGYLNPCLVKIGCFMDLFYSVKDLIVNNKNKNNDNSNSSNDSISDKSLIVTKKFARYFSQLGNTTKNGNRLLLTGVNPYEDEHPTLYDIIINEPGNDFLRMNFIGHYCSVYKVLPSVTKRNTKLFRLSSDLLNDLKTLGFTNVGIKRKNQNSYPQLIELDEIITHNQGGGGASVLMNNFKIFQSLLIGCHYKAQEEKNWFHGLGFADTSVENVIKLAMLLFVGDGDHITGLEDLKVLSFATDPRLQASSIFNSKTRAILRQEMLNKGCFEHLCLILNQSTSHEDDDTIAITFQLYSQYLDFDNVSKLFGIIKSMKRDNLLLFVSEKYFANTESKITQFMMNHSEYIHECFERANEGLSSLDNGTETALKLFGIFFNRENISANCGKEDFVERMIKSMETRVTLDKDKNYPRISMQNNQIISQLLESKEFKQVVINHLNKMYDEIQVEQKYSDYFSSKFTTSRGEQTNATNISPTILNFVVIHSLQKALYYKIADTIKTKKIDDTADDTAGDTADHNADHNADHTADDFTFDSLLNGFWYDHNKPDLLPFDETNQRKTETDEITQFFKWEIIDVCHLDYGYKDKSLYHIAVYYGNEDILKLLLDIDNDIVKYKIKNESALDVAMETGQWHMVKSILLVMYLFVFLSVSFSYPVGH